MPALTIVTDVENQGHEAMLRLSAANPGKTYLDLEREGKLIIVHDGVSVGALHAGMKSGKASVSIAFALPDERVVFLETSLELFTTAARTLGALYGGGPS